MSLIDWLIPTVYAPDEKMANELGLTVEQAGNLGDCCVRCNDINNQIKPVVLEEKSNIKIKFIKDVTINDCSVYSTEGVKRDYYSYKFDSKEEAIGLINATNNGCYIEITKIWKFKNLSDIPYNEGYITPDPLPDINNIQDDEIAIDEMTLIPPVNPNEEFDVSIPIKIPSIPGIYKRYFRLNDRDGRNVTDAKNNKFYLLFRVVPHKVISPVIGKIKSGDNINGMNTGDKIYENSETMYFCNWGLFYFDRLGNLKGNNKPDAYTHQYNDRHAWDVNAKSDADFKRCVFSISNGSVIKVSKKLGALWIQHDYIESKKDTTGYQTVYMHMLSESWAESSNAKDIWEIGAKVERGTLLGKIGGRDYWNDSKWGNHLHFAIYPLPCTQTTRNSVYAEIEQNDFEIPDECKVIRNLLVKAVTGPKNISTGKVATYTATEYSITSPTESELMQINWAIKSSGVIIEDFKNYGRMLKYSVPVDLSGKTIIVMPYANSPSTNVCVETKID